MPIRPLPDRPVSRAYAKLAGALDHFGVCPAGKTCVDFGCNVGGFTHCLLHRGAAVVAAVDTSRHLLDYSLRGHPAVLVLEGRNALHSPPPPDFRAQLAVVDVGWTPQSRILPAVLGWLTGGAEARIITLVKPHYEAAAKAGRLDGRAEPDGHRGRAGRRGGGTARTLSLEEAGRVAEGVRVEIGQLLAGWDVSELFASPVRGSGGNAEFLLLLGRARGGNGAA